MKEIIPTHGEMVTRGGTTSYRGEMPVYNNGENPLQLNGRQVAIRDGLVHNATPEEIAELRQLEGLIFTAQNSAGASESSEGLMQ